MRKPLGYVLVCVALCVVPAGRGAAESARALLIGTEPDSSIAGEVTMTDMEDSLQVSATISGASPGLHGFHIHEFGSCDNGGKAAGGHYNPDGVEHGNLLEDGPDAAHAGDLGNLKVGADGKGSYAQRIPELVLSEDEYSIAGRAFILHAQPDDFAQPTGNAGARIACGTIVITGQ